MPVRRKNRERLTVEKQRMRDREDQCRKAFIKGATEMPRELLEYQSELLGERTRPQKRDKSDLIRQCCEQARSGDGTGDTDRMRWFKQRQMLDAAGRSYKRYLESQGTMDFNLSDHNSKFYVLGVLINKDWWLYSVIYSCVRPTRSGRPNDMHLRVHNTVHDLHDSCTKCSCTKCQGTMSETCDFCQTLLTPQLWSVELKWGEAFLGPYDYGRRYDVNTCRSHQQ